MMSLVSRFGLESSIAFPATTIKLFGVNKVCSVFFRWQSSMQFGQFGSAPSQLPVPGEPGWQGFLDNVERAHQFPPLTPGAFRKGQRLFEMHKKYSKLEDVVTEFVKSNKKISDDLADIKRLLEKLHK